MKKHDSYKDSGIEWIGKIPEHWVIKKLKHIARICNGQDQKEVVDQDGIYPIYGSGGVFGKANSFLYDQPSVLLGRKGTIDKPQYVENPFWTVDTAYYTKIHSGFSARYFYYLCTTINFDLYKYGSAIPSMTQAHLNEIKFAIPKSIEEQTQLADYLDKKTSEIENLIAKKKQLISLLKEERTAIINHAVTKGIDPNVKLKKSGIEWIGEVPEHWEVTRIKYLGNIISGFSFKSEDFISSGSCRVMKISNIQTMRIDWKDESFVPDNFYEKYANFQIKKSDLVFALTRPIISTGIKAAIVEKDDKILLNQRNAVLRPNERILVNWMYYLIFNSKFISHFESFIDNTGQQPNISSTDIANIYIPLPSIHEQGVIIKYLEEKMGKLASILEKTEKEIDLMQEYKTALISEVVTGKIDVRDEVLV